MNVPKMPTIVTSMFLLQTKMDHLHVKGNLSKLTMFLFAVSDINECTTNTHNCHNNANCTNTNGSFTCECWNGFTGDGENCTGRCNQFTLIKFAATSSPHRIHW